MYSLIFLIVLTFTCTINAVPTAQSTLQNDFDDFIKIIDKSADGIVAIFLKYLAQDTKFQNEIKIIKSEQVKNLVQVIDNVPEFEEFIEYLSNEGITKIYEHVALIHNFLDIPVPGFVEEHLPHVIAKRNINTYSEKGLRGFLDEVENILDIDAFVSLYDEKLKTSESFKNFVNVLKGEKFKKIITTVQQDSNFKYLENKAIEAGIDVELVKTVLHNLFGW